MPWPGREGSSPRCRFLLPGTVDSIIVNARDNEIRKVSSSLCQVVNIISNEFCNRQLFFPTVDLFN